MKEVFWDKQIFAWKVCWIRGVRGDWQERRQEYRAQQGEEYHEKGRLFMHQPVDEVPYEVRGSTQPHPAHILEKAFWRLVGGGRKQGIR